MNKQRGVIAMVYLWAAGGIAATILALGAATWLQSSRLETCKAAAETFKAKVAAEGVAAEKARLQDILDRQAISTKQEEDNAKRYASLDSRYRAAVAAARLPRADSGSGQAEPLSSASTVLSCPDRQPDIAAKLGELEVGILAIAERGDKAIERTITCKSWIDEQVNKQP